MTSARPPEGGRTAVRGTELLRTNLATCPNSRALLRVDAAIAVLAGHGGDPVRHACRLAERAGLLARLGQVDEAQQQLADVRSGYDRQPNVRVTAWVCIAESLLAHFTNLSALARDKMQRAHALGAASGLKDVQAISAAWLATFHYANQDAQRMATHVAEALRLAAPDDHATRTRACMVVGLGLHFAERLDLAQPWYALARRHAIADADDASLSALTHNIAWHRGNHAVQASLFGDGRSPEGSDRYALAGADATGHLDDYAGNVSLGALVPILRAMMYSLQGLHGAALALYESYAAAAERQGLSRLRGNIRADMAWCRLQTGDETGARRDAVSAEAGLDVVTDHDDRAVAHARLAQVHARLGDETRRLAHEPRAREQWRLHRLQQAETLAALEPLVQHPGARAAGSPMQASATAG